MNPIKVGDVYDRSRAFLNDQGADVFSNDVLAPYLKTAYDDMRLEAEDCNIPFVNKTSSSITVNAGITSIGDPAVSTSPALPADLVEIIEMYERTAGSTNDFTRMTPVRFLPKTSVQTIFLECYAWQGQVVRLLGATSNIEVKIDYVANTLTRIVTENTLITINNAINVLSFRTAALAARYISEDKERSDELNSEAQRSLDLMQNIEIKNQQGMPVRRRPFRSGFRANRWNGSV